MSTLEHLKKIFSDFPGIGPRQSGRFVYFLLTRKQEYLDELIELLKHLKKETSLCPSCFRYFPKNGSAEPLCSICRNTERDMSRLMIVSRDIDLENIEKTGAYKGKYFVLGGTVPILEKEPEKRVRIAELLNTVEQSSNLEEIIVAMNANPEGDNTEEYVRDKLRNLTEKNTIKISTLGRGLSTGVELEYSDAETLKSALQNRH